LILYFCNKSAFLFQANYTMVVQHIQNAQEFHRILSDTDSLIVIDYFATWCGPCRAIAPFFDELSNKYSSCVFLKVDVDQQREIAQQQGIQFMPTFQFWLNNKLLYTIHGGFTAKLEYFVDKFATKKEISQSELQKIIENQPGLMKNIVLQLLRNLLAILFDLPTIVAIYFILWFLFGSQMGVVPRIVV